MKANAEHEVVLLVRVHSREGQEGRRNNQGKDENRIQKGRGQGGKGHYRVNDRED